MPVSPCDKPAASRTASSNATYEAQYEALAAPQEEMHPNALFNHASRARNQCGGYLHSQLFGRLKIDSKLNRAACE